MSHTFPIRIFYEDTDMAGIVYYANYLRYIERARSDIVEQLGLDQRAMRAEDIVFVITRVEADYLGTAGFGDRVDVRSGCDVGRCGHIPRQGDRCLYDHRRKTHPASSKTPLTAERSGGIGL